MLLSIEPAVRAGMVAERQEWEAIATNEDAPTIANTVEALEQGHDIVFLHNVQNGAAEKSYGIAVAKLAGLPARALKARTGTAKSNGRKWTVWTAIRPTPAKSIPTSPSNILGGRTTASVPPNHATAR